ncbi:MAG TPA: hypothetical protein VGE74_30865 [Gemmata sp.]
MPQYVVAFDIMIVATGAKWRTTPAGAILDPRTPPSTALDIVAPDTLVECLVDKPDVLNCGGLFEYVVFDPTNELLRPSLQGFRKVDGGFRPVRTALSGVFFGSPRFAFDVRGPEVRATPAGAPHLEEELFALRASRAAMLTGRTGRSVAALKQMNADIAALELRLESGEERDRL